ncbi:class I SAM-dependent methyltransferase [Paenibacillus lautus]|uniref:class I SAM-dependent methyltransferase n=1 Tax=Paenibacillus lautus TaxID=1401 RepID=UPI003D287B14
MLSKLEIAVLRNEMFDIIAKKRFPREALERICITEEDSVVINNIINRTKPHCILEVGSYVGVSTCLLAMKAPWAKVVAIDPNFSVLGDVIKHNSEVKDNSRDFYEELVDYYRLRERVERYDNYFSCFPAESTLNFHSLYNSKILEVQVIDEEILKSRAPFDLIFIDGDHNSSSVFSDLLRAYRYISNNGVILLHDMDGDWGEKVKRGVAQFLEGHPDLKLDINGNIGIIEMENVYRE